MNSWGQCAIHHIVTWHFAHEIFTTADLSPCVPILVIGEKKMRASGKAHLQVERKKKFCENLKRFYLFFVCFVFDSNKITLTGTFYSNYACAIRIKY